ncbi:MAG TPA: DUF58 domain-containing protein [Cyclobacteriaceae bacterium]|nr:DUF58 domain-containing protein [Cyclobacteriaceae bacterium]
MDLLKNLYLNNRFYLVFALLIAAMMLSYAIPPMMPIVQTCIVLLALAVCADVVMLFSPRVDVDVQRDTPGVLSLGDDNPIHLTIHNKARMSLNVMVIDEIPEQFQTRNFSISLDMPGGKTHVETYQLRPLSRGEYHFGRVNLYLATGLGLVRRRLRKPVNAMVPVYPSIIQMKKYELKTFARTAVEYGVKKVRRIGHSYEFEHIKQYNRGDDYRSINWKATGRRAQLMVNVYEDEKSQAVYTIIDKSRVMHMPFHGLSLFDYAVNASLVIANIVLGKQDKAGLLTFAEEPKARIRADRGKHQLKKILEALYNETEGSVEANYESMYMSVRDLVNGRALLFFYTNFESTYALQRALPQLRKLNDKHLLVVVFFENTEVSANTSENVETMEDIYRQVTAENYMLTKVQLVQMLRQFGIMSILTKPENLTVSSINKYLELKSRGMI